MDTVTAALYFALLVSVVLNFLQSALGAREAAGHAKRERELLDWGARLADELAKSEMERETAATSAALRSLFQPGDLES